MRLQSEGRRWGIRENGMGLLLGIDTGGTYTDAAVYEDGKGVVGSAKALTTKHDLSIGIREALKTAMPPSPEEIRLVSLSTTLATNAVVEGQGSPVCLILIGYAPDLMVDIDIGKIVPEPNILYLRGGHASDGREMEPLNLTQVREAIQAAASGVEAFAVSGYFGVRNPDHEIQVRRLVRQMTGKPVTCGHELTTRLHAPRRAVTVAMNARLIPLLDELIQTVRQMLGEAGINAPLMVVKGDGSLVSAEIALERPVETILSGPAASVVGAGQLAGVEDAFVVDMGGTTTDIAMITKGRPVLNPNGAHIDGWQIMIEAIDAQTTGLGGDSEIGLDADSGLAAGPRRVVPLCLLAVQHPDVPAILATQAGDPLQDPDVDKMLLGRFVLQQRRLPNGGGDLSDTQRDIWQSLATGPKALHDLLTDTAYPPMTKRAIDELSARGLVVLSSFTPTDALHVLGRYRGWCVEAAERGAALWAHRMGTGVEQLCKDVICQVEKQMGRAVIHSALAKEGRIPASGAQDAGRFLVDRALDGVPSEPDGDIAEHALSVSIRLSRPLVAVGAPVENYMPAVSRRLGTDLCIPDHAEIDNAVGAAVAGVVQTVRVLIQPVDDGESYRVHLPFGVEAFSLLEDAVSCGKAEAGLAAEEKARRAGADDIDLHVERHDRIVAGREGSAEEIFIDTEIIATAVGRPQLGKVSYPASH